MDLLLCPKCKCQEIQRVTIQDRSSWFPGAYRCTNCNHLEAWGVFCQPQLQMDLPFEEASPEEQHRRLVHQGTIALFAILSPDSRSDRERAWLPDEAILKAILRGELRQEELVESFRAALADVIAYKTGKKP